jgi:quinol-cytochrome oxidoreductase complex cytochrome b subunit
VHIALVRLQGVTEQHFRDEPTDKPAHFPFFPDHLYTELIIGLLLMIVLSVLATVLPAELGPKADPLTTPEVIKPEWFFYVAFRWLKLWSGTAAIASMGGIMVVFAGWPFIDAWLRRHTRFQEASVIVGIAGVLAIIGLTVWEAVVAH